LFQTGRCSESIHAGTESVE